ncbi:hypothetical protein T12_15871 [Trichinella patagoniensis]|uniref:Uncharacterized protein n=1 Tax=Trichinella patagoniensis TaxID=990121 RepID=A0A0V0Z9B5_9BILA|nr:hypothetical protein T12_15871 [Trichinella patagoniensis]
MERQLFTVCARRFISLHKNGIELNFCPLKIDCNCNISNRIFVLEPRPTEAWHVKLPAEELD